MAISWRWWIVVPVILGGMLLAACGDDGDNGEPSDTGPSDDGVVATEPAEDMTEEEPAEDGDGDDVEAGGDAFEGVPVPSGAREGESGQWSGTIPGLVPGAGVEPGDFTSIEFIQYEVDGSPSDVIGFYQDNLEGWNEEFVFSGGTDGDEGGIGVWTRNDRQEALWITAGASDGATDLIVLHGSAE